MSGLKKLPQVMNDACNELDNMALYEYPTVEDIRLYINGKEFVIGAYNADLADIIKCMLLDIRSYALWQIHNT